MGQPVPQPEREKLANTPYFPVDLNSLIADWQLKSWAAGDFSVNPDISKIVLTPELLDYLTQEVEHSVRDAYKWIAELGAAQYEMAKQWALKGNTGQVEHFMGLLERSEQMASPARLNTYNIEEIKYWLARGLMRKGEREEALKLIPQMSLRRAAEIYLHFDMEDEAEKTLEAMASMRQEDEYQETKTEHAKSRVLAYLCAEKMDLAKEVIKKARLDQDDLSKIYPEAAYNFFQLGETEKARPVVEKALAETIGSVRQMDKIRSWLPSLGWSYEAAFYIQDSVKP
jgi:hypothetical protein